MVDFTFHHAKSPTFTTCPHVLIHIHYTLVLGWSNIDIIITFLWSSYSVMWMGNLITQSSSLLKLQIILAMLLAQSASAMV